VLTLTLLVYIYMNNIFKKRKITSAAGDFGGRARKGFTLIELLVVIAIIGILASVVLASLNTARRKSRDARRIADLKQIQLALELFFDSNREYPDTVAGLVSTYIPVEPRDPSSAASYPYDNVVDSAGASCAIATGACLYYHIGANLEEDCNTGTGVGATACTGGNPALNSDRDVTMGGFAGASTDCVAAAGTTDGCYDLTP